MAISNVSKFSFDRKPRCQMKEKAKRKPDIRMYIKSVFTNRALLYVNGRSNGYVMI